MRPFCPGNAAFADGGAIRTHAAPPTPTTRTASIASSVVIRLHITLPLSSVRHDRMHVVAVAASDHARLICTRHLRRANPSTSDRASSESQYRRSRCPHSGHLRIHSPSSRMAFSVLELLLTTTVTAFPYRGLLLLDRSVSLRPAASPALSCAAWTVGLLARGRCAAVCLAHW
jgi:hypothetical protein